MLASSYGKSHIRVTKVTRHADRHELKEFTVDIQLEGDFDGSYTEGDNRLVVATDSMKNMVYVLARQHPLTDLESFAQTLARQFLERYAQVKGLNIHMREDSWQRIMVDGRPHPHAFVGGGDEKRTCHLFGGRDGLHILSGLTDLLLLKTTDSGFAGFVRDEFTTLPETDDRIFATLLTAEWYYGAGQHDWNSCHQTIRQTLLETFARHHSLSVQQTLHAMGTAALEACSDIQTIKLSMPNQHRLLVNLKPFGLDNPNVIFVPTDEPYGMIRATIGR